MHEASIAHESLRSKLLSEQGIAGQDRELVEKNGGLDSCICAALAGGFFDQIVVPRRPGSPQDGFSRLLDEVFASLFSPVTGNAYVFFTEASRRNCSLRARLSRRAGRRGTGGLADCSETDQKRSHATEPRCGRAHHHCSSCWRCRGCCSRQQGGTRLDVGAPLASG
jgi:hypothetical protein